MSDKKKLLNLAESLVKYGRNHGADEIEVSIDTSTEFSVNVLKGEIEKLVEAGSKGLGIRIIKDKKTATVSSSDFNNETLHHLIDDAIKRAELSSPDPFAGLPQLESETKIVAAKELHIFDRQIAELTPEKKIELARQTEAICFKDGRIKNSYGATFGSYVGDTMLVNSYGFTGSYEQTSCSLGVYLQAGEGDHKVEDGWFEGERYFSKLWTPEQIATMAIHRVTRLIGAKKIATQNVPVVLESSMSPNILAFLYQCVNGNAIYMKRSFLVDKIGEKIANENVTIIDDGLLPGAPGTKPFDGEGVPSRKNVVVDRGVLKSYLMDTYSARKLNMKSTGNASGPNNFYLEQGSYTPEEIIKSVDNGLLLTGTMGQGTNQVTGDFSRGAFGMWIEKGEIAYPVSEITISSNLAQMLMNIDMIGNDLRFTGSICGPTVRIKEMTVGGI